MFALRNAVKAAVISQKISFPSLQNQVISSAIFGGVQTRSRHGCCHSDFRDRYFILRDRPLGPDKKLPPGKKLMGKIGPHENYRRIVHYPEDGEYTIRRLPITKLGGRDPVTGRKIIQAVGGGSKQKYRWVAPFRLPKDWDRDGPDLIERVISVNYDPCRKSMLALCAHGNSMRWLIATEGMKVDIDSFGEVFSDFFLSLHQTLLEQRQNELVFHVNNAKLVENV
jgi:hypothetical protein